MREILLGDDVGRIVEVINESLKNKTGGLNKLCEDVGITKKYREQISEKIKNYGYEYSKQLIQFILATEKAEKELEYKKSKQKKSPATKPKNEVKIDTDILARVEQLEMQVKALQDTINLQLPYKQNASNLQAIAKQDTSNLQVIVFDEKYRNKNYYIYDSVEQKLQQLYKKYPQYKKMDVLNTILIEGLDKYL